MHFLAPIVPKNSGRTVLFALLFAGHVALLAYSLRAPQRSNATMRCGHPKCLERSLRFQTARPETPQLCTTDLVVLIDTSGSMHGKKLREAKRLAKGHLDQLSPGSSFRVHTFSDRTELLAKGSIYRGVEGNLDGVKMGIDRLVAQGKSSLAVALNSVDTLYLPAQNVIVITDRILLDPMDIAENVTVEIVEDQQHHKTDHWCRIPIPTR